MNIFKLHASSFLEMNKILRRWRLFSFMSIIIILLLLCSHFRSHSYLNDDSITVDQIKSDLIVLIKLDGVIGSDEYRNDVLGKLADNKNVKAVIVEIDSPGGEIFASYELYKQFKLISDRVPVVAVMKSLAASGGYMVALGADYILASEVTMTGSIGVLMQSYEVTDLGEKLGIVFNSYKSSTIKGSPTLYEKETPEVKKAMMEIINDSYNLFVKMVSDNRNISLDLAKKVSDGRVYMGGKALKLGLIDSIGGKNDAIKYIKEKGIDKPVTEVILQKKVSVVDKFLKSLVSNIVSKSHHSVPTAILY